MAKSTPEGIQSSFIGNDSKDTTSHKNDPQLDDDFQDPEADVSIISSDNISFRVHSCRLMIFRSASLLW